MVFGGMFSKREMLQLETLIYLRRLSEHTVKNHVQRVLFKLKVNTRAQAIAKVLNQSQGPQPYKTFRLNSALLTSLMSLIQFQSTVLYELLYI
ncbi:MAG: LuxR C-terminal-related transcriptional regulator [Gallionellaceae bacterium]|jgi:hypothetical protein